MNKEKLIQIVFGTKGESSYLLPLRIVLGIIFIAHGGQKLFGWFGGYGLEGTAGFFEAKLGMSPGILFAFLAGAGEFFGGILVMLGLATRFGAFNLAVTMVVAIYTVHGGSFFAPAGMEYPLALLAMSITLLISGGGSYSLDRVVVEKLNASPEPTPTPQLSPAS